MQARKSLFILSACVLLVWGSAAQAGYIDNGDGTVTDTGTGLMWQQATAPGAHTWEQALDYCENLILNNDGLWTSGAANASGAKYDDWRLPTAKELASIVDSTRYNPAINILYFPDTVASYYWSSTTNADNTTIASFVKFSGGLVNSSSKSGPNYVRAVRSGQYGSFDNLTLWPVPDTGQTLCYDSGAAIACPAPGQPFYGQDASYSINTPAYTKLAAGGAALPDNATSWATVLDEVTGLVWEEKHDKDDVKNYADPNDADNLYTWYDNNSATNGGNAGTPGNGTDTMDFIRVLNAANYGGFSDWRMPAVKELQSIVDYGRYSPSINMTYFPNTIASGYLSSTTNAYVTSGAWILGFSYGVIANHNKADPLYVRAVRVGQYGLSGDLVISKSGAGGGTVASGDGKIDCGSDCSEKYSIGTEVTLTAAAAAGSTFTGWSGGGCTGIGQCVLTILDNATVTVAADFDVVPTTTTTTAASTTTTAAVSTTTSIISTTTSTTSVVTTTTTTPAETPCTVRLAPGKISRLFSIIKPVGGFFIRGDEEASFSRATDINWGTEGVKTLFKISLGKKAIFAVVLFRPMALEVGATYDVTVGGCTGELSVKQL